ncbi:hypothetical protein OG946_26495 [Streptomyces sp. NBC_01808]|uniref:hypothetical protein n=1 Tax=Streptomyces sp. NBC_01808 TaxID=2975947 RepID=UPI002DDA83CF|nr:hypothetical protein [Streptomyces sp. NBC_01808]WSA40611.1 hypothetical protein OG946_26495 [Streptomyces sp. NBC_01808]
MSVRMFRAKIKEDRVETAEKAAKELFAAIEEAKPEGVRYSWCKLADGRTLVLVVDLEDDEKNPLLTMPAFQETMNGLKNEWIAEPLSVEPMTSLGSYRLFY